MAYLFVRALLEKCRSPKIGVAYNKSVPSFVTSHPDEIDYVEVPYELLAFDPGVLKIQEHKPIVLHCASLSIGGSVACPEPSIHSIVEWAKKTKSPWVGEHLAFITAEKELHADEYAPGEPYNIGYTVSPPMNRATVDRVCRNLARYRERFDVPILLENSPLYFSLPDSSMTQVEFLNSICEKSDAKLLLDLAHFFITSQTMEFDPVEALGALPLERIVEVHISGVDNQEGSMWDNHASKAPQIVFELLSNLLKRVDISAITLEYNWSVSFPESALLEELEATRKCIHRTAKL